MTTLEWRTKRTVLDDATALQELTERRLLYVVPSGLAGPVVHEYGWSRPAGRMSIYLMSDRKHQLLNDQAWEATAEGLIVPVTYLYPDARAVTVPIRDGDGGRAREWRISAL